MDDHNVDRSGNHFYVHPKYVFDGEWRMDTHPRYSHDGGYVCIDSPHDDAGRQMCLLDIRGIVARKKWH
jgi:hypothetical protein